MEGSLPERERFAKIPGGILFAGLEAIDIAVYAAIAYHWFPDGDCFPSMRVLCEITSLSRPTIWKSLRRMEEVGILQIVRKNGAVSHYDLPLNRLTTLTGCPKPSVNRLSRLTPTGKPPLQVTPKPVKQVNTNQTCTRSTEPDKGTSVSASPQRARKPAKPKSDFRFGDYIDAFTEIKGRTPNHTAGDAANMKRTETTHGKARTLEVYRHYLTSEDNWIRSKGHCFGVFFGNFDGVADALDAGITHGRRNNNGWTQGNQQGQPKEVAGPGRADASRTTRAGQTRDISEYERYVQQQNQD